MTSEKKTKLTYWIVTTPFVATMLMASLALLMSVPANVEGITILGYPVYVCKILGTAKLFGGIAIIQKKFTTLKEWAYAGYSFNLIGAAASHILHGDDIIKISVPLIIFSVVMISYFLWKRINHAL